MKAKKLIEVAMPIKEISAESVRDKSIRHGHISTLHLWWARRPLPTCRAVVFASLVPDPLDDNCPESFRKAVSVLLGKPAHGVDLYAPYKDIPYTATIDSMEDNLRNRLMMFIGKFSDGCQRKMIAGESVSPKDQLSDGSLIKWENKDNPHILRIARELIWVAYNSDHNRDITYETLHDAFDRAFDAIGVAEQKLYSITDRHLESDKVRKAEQQLREAIDNFQQQMPSVFDPFAGGGAIPLEAARLGCRSYGNDINPVAHIIEKGSAEFPQKYGKPITYSHREFMEKYGDEGVKLYAEKYGSLPTGDFVINNRLAWDVEYYARLIIIESEKEIGYLYPKDENGNKPVAYYWARTAKCSNPSCGADVPMLKQFYLCNTSKKKVFLNPIINGKDISFEMVKGKSSNITPFLKGRECSLTCPCCGSITDGKNVKSQSKNHQTGERLLAVIWEGENGKTYTLPSEKDIETCHIKLDNIEKPSGDLPQNDSQNLKIPLWGYETWASMFSDRQLNAINTIIKHFKTKCNSESEYDKSVKAYLAIIISRIIVANNSFWRWSELTETIVALFSKQAIPMIFDYPESNIFCNSSGSASNQIDWVVRYIESECSFPFSAYFANSSSGDKLQFEEKSLCAVVTDPPYYDAIAYADLSDFFYVWMKQTLGGIYPIVFATPNTPKTEECTAIKHHFNGDEKAAEKHFEKKLTGIFDAIEQQTTDIVSIMFAHQSTKAWTTLCNSILDARMNITGSWPMDTERDVRPMGLAGAALESSVTVACRPSERKGFGEFREVKRDIERKVKEEVESLYALGFRGADLLTACFGQAVSEFGRYKTVEKADGSTVTVAELLDLAKQTAFNALLQGIDADDETRFYIGWLRMNGMGETDYDDATKFTRVGMNIEISDIFRQGLLVRDGNKQHLATAAEHLEAHSKSKGTSKSDLLIEQVHRAMLFYKGSGGDRRELLRLIRDVAPDANDSFWRVLASLKELLPAGDDLQQVQGLLQNGENLRRECKDVDNQTFTQGTITFGE